MILAPLRIRSFRFQWPADLLTSWAFEMETLVLGWYVMAQTGSVVWLTAFGSLQFLGTLASPMVGVLGDRLGGRTMLCAMRAVYASLAAGLALLALGGWLTPAWVLIVTGVAGVIRPNDQVIRNALIGETIPAAHLIGAVGMSRATMDSARVVGALAGAGLSAFLGLGPTYVFVTAFYAAGLALTFGVARRPPVPDPGASGRRTPYATATSPPARVAATRTSPSPAPPAYRATARPRSSGWQALRDGLAHVLRTPPLLAMMLLAFLVNLTAYPVSGGLLPYVAQRVYQVDATGLGWLVASFAFGGLLASSVTVVRGGPRRPERATLVGTAIWYVCLLAFGHLPSFGAGLVALLLAGFAQNIAMISMMATILAGAGGGFHGRVMGVRMLAVYGLPLGLIGAGVLIQRLGYPLTITAFTMIGLGCTLAIGSRWRASLWRAGPRPAPASAAQRV